LNGDEFADALFSATIYVVAAEGLVRSVEEYLDHQLRRDSSSLGCLEIDPANRVHWVLYTQKLIPRYQYLDGEIRLFYREFEEGEGADTKDLSRAADLERQGFRVAWEDIGLRYTIFDSYQSFEHAARLADLQTYLSEHLARVADEILLRTLQRRHPRLCAMGRQTRLGFCREGKRRRRLAPGFRRGPSHAPKAARSPMFRPFL